MFDRLLLILLVIMLPLGVIISTQFLNKGNKEVDATEEEIARIEAALDRVADSKKDPVIAEEKPEITLSEAVYASESAILRINGKAPEGDYAVFVSATVLPHDEAIPELNEVVQPDVLGQMVDVISLRTQPDGSFTYEYGIDVVSGMVEVRFEQGESSATVRYNLDTQKVLGL